VCSGPLSTTIRRRCRYRSASRSKLHIPNDVVTVATNQNSSCFIYSYPHEFLHASKKSSFKVLVFLLHRMNTILHTKPVFCLKTKDSDITNPVHVTAERRPFLLTDGFRSFVHSLQANAGTQFFYRSGDLLTEAFCRQKPQITS
jgi:hypothetical protein